MDNNFIERIGRLESDINHQTSELSSLWDSHHELKDALKDLANGLHRLAIAEAKREEDRAAFKRIFESLREERDRLDALEKTLGLKELEAVKSALLEQQSSHKRIMMEFLRTLLIVGASLILYHFSVPIAS